MNTPRQSEPPFVASWPVKGLEMERQLVGHGVPDRLRLARTSNTLQDSLWAPYLLTQHSHMLNTMDRESIDCATWACIGNNTLLKWCSPHRFTIILCRSYHTIRPLVNHTTRSKPHMATAIFWRNGYIHSQSIPNPHSRRLCHGV